MSTRSHIGIVFKDNTILIGHCQHDGYLEHNGKILFEKFTDIEQVKELIQKELCFIENDGKPDYYEEDYKPIKFYTYLKYQQYLERSEAEFVYLFSENKNKWLVTDKNFVFYDLEKTLRKNKIID